MDCDITMYACVLADGFICGIGRTPDDAHAAGQQMNEEVGEEVWFAVRPCTPTLAELVRVWGGDIAYDDPDGVLTPNEDSNAIP